MERLGECLSVEDKNREVVDNGGGGKFRFGGGKVLTALGRVMCPAQLAGNEVMISSHVVNSPIPLLWSQPSMVRARPNSLYPLWGYRSWVWTD